MRLVSRHIKFSFGVIAAVALLSAAMQSCISPKRAIYFNNLPDTLSTNASVTVETPAYIDPVILPNDNIFVQIQTIDQNESSTPLTTANQNLNPYISYLVDQRGFIELPLVGYVKIGGLSTAEARELVKQKAKEFYKDPVVKLRITNFDITLIGEVKSPNVYAFPNEKVSIVEAIGNAGDFNLTGRRENVLLVRTEGNTRKFVKFNFNSTDIFKSPYFYLRQRDIIYVKPTKYRVQSSDNQVTRNISIISSIVSLGLLFFAIRNIK